MSFTLGLRKQDIAFGIRKNYEEVGLVVIGGRFSSQRGEPFFVAGLFLALLRKVEVAVCITSMVKESVLEFHCGVVTTELRNLANTQKKENRLLLGL